MTKFLSQGGTNPWTIIFWKTLFSTAIAAGFTVHEAGGVVALWESIVVGSRYYAAAVPVVAFIVSSLGKVHDLLLQNNVFLLIIVLAFQTVKQPITFFDPPSIYIFPGQWHHILICLHINGQGIAIDFTESGVVRRSGQVIPW